MNRTATHLRRHAWFRVYTSTDHIHVSRLVDSSKPADRITSSIRPAGCTKVRNEFFVKTTLRVFQRDSEAHIPDIARVRECQTHFRVAERRSSEALHTTGSSTPRDRA